MGKGMTVTAVIAALAVLLVASWYTMFDTANKKEKAYNESLSNARSKWEEGLREDAKDAYQQVIAIYDSIAIREEISDFYLKNAYIDDYITFCDSTISKYPKDEKAYVRLAEYYMETESYNNCISIINNSRRRGVRSETLDGMIEEIKKLFRIVSTKFNEVDAFSGGLALVKRGDSWGYADAYGNLRLGFLYEDGTPFNGSNMVVKRTDTDEYILIDMSNRDKSRDTSGKKIEDALSVFGGVMILKYDGKYHYCNTDFVEYFQSGYDYASAFSGDRAVVKDGSSWYIIDNSGKKVGDKTFEEIKVDERGIAFVNGVAFAKEGGRYILIDANGNQVGSESWTDVDCFNMNQPAAVFNGTFWGYVDSTGAMVSEYKYYGAKSFSNGFAAIEEYDKWGYIRLDDYSVAVPCEYQDCGDFNDAGSAFVKINDLWDILRFYIY